MHTPRSHLITLIGVLAFAFGSAAIADDVHPSSSSSKDAREAKVNQVALQRNETADNWRAMRASKLMGKRVHNAQGEQLGKIEDLVVDVNHDIVYYAILSFGGAVDKLFAYPVRLFQQDPRREQVVLDVDKQKLIEAPGFETKHWPTWNEDDYRARVDRYYGDRVALNPKPNMLLRRASNLLGADVMDRNGKDVGDIKDLVVDMRSGKVQFVAVEFDKSWGKPGRWTELPLRAFRPSSDERDKMVLRVSQKQIATAPGFPANRWTNVQRTYRSDIDAWFRGLGSDATAASDRASSDAARQPSQQ